MHLPVVRSTLICLMFPHKRNQLLSSPTLCLEIIIVRCWCSCILSPFSDVPQSLSKRDWPSWSWWRIRLQGYEHKERRLGGPQAIPKGVNNRMMPSCYPTSYYEGLHLLVYSITKYLEALQIPGRKTQGLFKLLSPPSMRRTCKLWSRFANLQQVSFASKRQQHGFKSSPSCHNTSTRPSSTHNDIKFIWDRHTGYGE